MGVHCRCSCPLIVEEELNIFLSASHLAAIRVVRPPHRELGLGRYIDAQTAIAGPRRIRRHEAYRLQPSCSYLPLCACSYPLCTWILRGFACSRLGSSTSSTPLRMRALMRESSISSLSVNCR